MRRIRPGIAILLFAVVAGAQSGDDLARLSDLSRSAWKSGDFSAAAAWYERATSMAPNEPGPVYDLALSYYRRKSYQLAAQYLDRAQRRATGPLLGKCLLLRADIEYRNALLQNATGQVEGLERALALYRHALAGGADSETARYDIEVVKLRLPPARSVAPKVGTDSPQDDSADHAAAGGTGQQRKDGGKGKPEDRDW